MSDHTEIKMWYKFVVQVGDKFLGKPHTPNVLNDLADAHFFDSEQEALFGMLSSYYQGEVRPVKVRAYIEFLDNVINA